MQFNTHTEYTLGIVDPARGVRERQHIVSIPPTQSASQPTPFTRKYCLATSGLCVRCFGPNYITYQFKLFILKVHKENIEIISEM